ncbi:hypothetical protein [Sinorhizobium meliloti]|uniref:hypothetical protein n=1 Tax=Rhizobium meliloti TaxID=382 RepID=UPI000666B739|nr:hypothetical protein SMRU11_17335 [Sinorhizobium meliloti RU11/001]
MPAVPLKLTAVTVFVSPASGSVFSGEHVPSGRRAAGAVENADLLGGVEPPSARRSASSKPMFKVSLAATLPRSLAVPPTEIVPTLVDVGVPLKVRVEG